MCPRRRTLLKAGGAIGLGGGIAYWQRRRIRRLDDLNAIRRTLDMPVPTVSDPVIVTADHLDAAYSWARQHVERTADELPDSQAEDSGPLERAKEHLADAVPSEVEEDERRDALEKYEHAVIDSAGVRGRHIESGQRSPSDELQTARQRLGEELDDFDLTYAGDLLTRVVVQAAHVESLIGDAKSRYSQAADYMADEDLATPVAWKGVETGRFLLFNVEQFLEVFETDGTQRWNTDLEDLVDRLEQRIESATGGVQWELDSDIPSFAYHRWVDVRADIFSEPQELLDDGEPAQAVLAQAEYATVAETLTEFDDFPRPRNMDDIDIELVDDAEDLLTEKRTAKKRLDAAVDAVGSDPLGRYLLRQATERLERADTTLDRLRSDVNSENDTQWQNQLDRTALEYRGVAADAEVIPDTVALIRDF